MHGRGCIVSTDLNLMLCHVLQMKKVSSHASYLSELDTEEFTELEANMSIIDEFYYGIRVFPGQDPNQVK